MAAASCATDKVACRTPAKGRDGTTAIPAWKFQLIRGHLFDLLRAGDLAFADLRGAVAARLTPEQSRELGSVGWHVTTVKLELEVRGEIARRSGPGRQIVTLGPNAPLDPAKGDPG